MLGALLTAAGLASSAVAIVGMASSWGERRSQAVAAAPTTPAGTTSTASLPRSTSAPAPSVSPSSAGQTAEQFLTELTGAIHSHDVPFLLSRLNSGVLVVYGRRQCARFLRTFPDVSFAVHNVRKLAKYVWRSDHASITVTNAVAVDVDYTVQGRASHSVVHLQSLGTTYAWFTDCGTPVAQR